MVRQTATKAQIKKAKKSARKQMHVTVFHNLRELRPLSFIFNR